MALSLSKKFDNHISAIWYFIRYYNDMLLPNTRIREIIQNMALPIR